MYKSMHSNKLRRVEQSPAGSAGPSFAGAGLQTDRNRSMFSKNAFDKSGTTFSNSNFNSSSLSSLSSSSAQGFSRSQVTYDASNSLVTEGFSYSPSSLRVPTPASTPASASTSASSSSSSASSQYMSFKDFHNDLNSAGTEEAAFPKMKAGSRFKARNAGGPTASAVSTSTSTSKSKKRRRSSLRMELLTDFTRAGEEVGAGDV